MGTMTVETVDLRRHIELGEGIHVLRSHQERREWNGIRYRIGLSGQNVGSRKLSMNIATIPPGAIARAHIHVDFEVMLFIISGRVRHLYGPGLTETADNEAGDFIFIEPGLPHEVHNRSDEEPVVAVVARSDAREWENIIAYEV